MKEQIILVYPPQGKGAPFRFLYTEAKNKPVASEAIISAVRVSFMQQNKACLDFSDWVTVIDRAVAIVGGRWEPLQYDVTVWL